MVVKRTIRFVVLLLYKITQFWSLQFLKVLISDFLFHHRLWTR